MAAARSIDDDHPNAPHADHILVTVCGCGTLRILLRDAGGRLIAAAPFPVDQVQGLADMLVQCADEWMTRDKARVN